MQTEDEGVWSTLHFLLAGAFPEFPGQLSVVG